MPGRGWYSRGYLPHIDSEGSTQFLGWRLDDALPVHLIEKWKHELASMDLTDTKRKLELARRIDAYCDQGHGACVLRNPLAAKAAQEVLLAHHRSLYYLHAWVIMPNHVHAMLTPVEGSSLAKILRDVKGGSAYEVNKVLGRSGRLWQADYFDRLVRNERHFAGACRYIEWNPVKAKLCSDPKLWTWSSAHPGNRERLAD